MNAKAKYLSQAFELERAIKNKLEHIHRLESLASESTQSFGGESGGSSGHTTGSKIENFAIQIVMIKDEIMEIMNALLQKRAEIANVIHAVNNIECENLLEERYLNFYDWQKMADSRGVSKAYLYHKHGEALKLVHIPE